MEQPYRTNAPPEADAGAPPRAESGWACGELTIAIMLAALGALGILGGFVTSSSECELSLGVLLLMLAVKVFVEERRARQGRSVT